MYETNTIELISHIFTKFSYLWKLKNIAANSLTLPLSGVVGGVSLVLPWESGVVTASTERVW